MKRDKLDVMEIKCQRSMCAVTTIDRKRDEENKRRVGVR